MSVTCTRTRFRLSAFTLIEVLVVIAIIGILATVVLFNLSEARESGRVARAETELKSIEAAFKLYLQETGSMPPGRDHCSLCGWGGWSGSQNVDSQNLWYRTTNATPAIVPHVSSVIPARIPERDPWGRPYAYDNNFQVNGSSNPSIICSVGLNGRLDTWLTSDAAASQREAQGDDVCVFFVEPDDA